MIVGGSVRPFRVRLRSPLDTGAGRIAERRGALVEVRDAAGRRGLGEATPLPGHPAFVREDADESERALRAALEALGREGVRTPLDALARLPDWTPSDRPAARFGLETALADLASRQEGRRLADWLAGPATAASDRISVNALVAGADPDAVRASAEEALRHGFRTFKLKVGVAPPDEDARRVDALRRVVGPGATVRLDANGAWSPDLAREALKELERFEPEYVEDPVAVRGPDDVEVLRGLRSVSRVPLAADDCGWDPSCVEALLGLRACDWLVLKAAPLGGLAAARALAQRAQASGLRCVVTSTLDAAVGLCASLHLAASLQLEHACGLGTASWLAEDVAAAPPVENGWMAVPSAPGLGLELAWHSGRPDDG